MADGSSNRGPHHTPAMCYCRCHADLEHGMSAYPKRTDPIGAATACSRCKHLHAVAFIDTKEDDAA
jgi:hypothetical protein